MSQLTARAALKWGVGPALALALAAVAGSRFAPPRGGKLGAQIERLPPLDLLRLEAVPARAVANVVWPLGDAELVKRSLRVELDALGETDNIERARAFLRFGAVDHHPEGQAAVVAQACAADPSVCDHIKEAMQRETELRYVAPGNRLPVYFVPGHPPVP